MRVAVPGISATLAGGLPSHCQLRLRAADAVLVINDAAASQLWNSAPGSQGNLSLQATELTLLGPGALSRPLGTHPMGNSTDVKLLYCPCLLLS